MDSVTLDGKIYLKATKAAVLVGYTSDYIGQLCRKGTLDAIVLGKTWYVREESLLAHKQSQMRMNTAMTRRDIQRQQKEQKTNLHAEHHVGLHNTMPTAAEYRNRLLETSIQYSPDTHDLLPSVVTERPVYTERPSADNQTAQDEEFKAISEHPTQVDEEETPIDEHTDEGIAEDESDTENESTMEEDDDKEEEMEEISVPIRKIASVARTETFLARTAHQMREVRTQRAEKNAYFAQDDEDRGEQKTIMKPPTRGIALYRSPLSVICLFLFLCVLANIVLESTWSYTDTGSKQAQLKTTYNLASTSSIIQVLREVRF